MEYIYIFEEKKMMNFILLNSILDGIGQGLWFALILLIIFLVNRVRKIMLHQGYIGELEKIKENIEEGKSSNETTFSYVKDITKYKDLDYINLEIKKHKKNAKRTLIFLLCLVIIPFVSYNFYSNYKTKQIADRKEAVFQKQYSGEWKEGQYHGQGRLKFDDGIYEGVFNNGKIIGPGIMKFNNGDSFDGNSISEWSDGWEVEIMERGLSDGSFKDAFLYVNYSYGNGIIKYNNGNTYKGESYSMKPYYLIRENLYKGVMNFQNGDSYEGLWGNEYFPFKKGTYIWANGDSYTGEFGTDANSGVFTSNNGIEVPINELDNLNRYEGQGDNLINGKKVKFTFQQHQIIRYGNCKDCP